MELLELVSGFKQTLGVESLKQAQQQLAVALFDVEKREVFFDKWLEFCPDLSKDYMQIIFQYYLADTKNLGQDYTPVCLGALLSELCDCENEDIIEDLCSGSGSLTIQRWNKNKNLSFICKEFDEKVIPFLLFNLSIRNINASVIHCDVLSGDIFAMYKLTASEKYSDIKEVSDHGENLY